MEYLKIGLLDYFHSLVFNSSRNSVIPSWKIRATLSDPTPTHLVLFFPLLPCFAAKLDLLLLSMRTIVNTTYPTFLFFFPVFQYNVWWKVEESFPVGVVKFSNFHRHFYLSHIFSILFMNITKLVVAVSLHVMRSWLVSVNMLDSFQY